MATKTAKSKPHAPAANGEPMLKVVEDAGIRLKFRFHQKVGESYRAFVVHAWIVDADRWNKSPESKDKAWYSQILPGERIAAMRAVNDSDRDTEPDDPDDLFGGDEPDPEATKLLGELRNRLLTFFENDDEVRSLSLSCGGNGTGRFEVILDDHFKGPGRRLPLILNVRFDSEDN